MKLRAGKDIRANVGLAFSFAIFAALGLIAAVVTINSYKASADVKVVQEQKVKAEAVASQVRNFLFSATQIAQSQRAFVENYKGKDKAVIESYMDHFLESASEDLIYGTGVWYEPNQFRAEDYYFGPYMHRGDKPGTRVLTYEWNGADYNYPSHDWYQLAANAKFQPIFSEPYLDRDLVYMTLGLGFRDQTTKAFKGVISVGMTIPQLQKIIETVNEKAEGTTYIIGRSNQIIAHPNVKELMVSAQKSGGEREIRSILDTSFEDGILPIASPVIYKETIGESDWQVVVVSPFRSIYKEFLDFRSIVINLTVAYLVALLVVFRLILYFRRRVSKLKQEASLDRQADIHEMRKALDLAQVGILRTLKDGSIRGGYTLASYPLLGRMQAETSSLTQFKIWDLLALDQKEREEFAQLYAKIFDEPYLADEFVRQINRQLRVKAKLLDLRCFPVRLHGQMESILVVLSPLPAQ